MNEPTRPTTDVLIELGRDREAVAASARELRTHPRGDGMDGVEQLDEIIPTLVGLVDRITPEQLDRPTPCVNFTVAGVLEHMIGGASMFAPAFRGGGEPASFQGTPQERFRAAMTDLLDAVHDPQAQSRTIASPFGDVPGSMFARYVAFDGLVHGWDLATATSQEYTPSDRVVAEVDTYIRGLLQPAMRDGDTFAAEQEPPADASPLEKVVAFSGRRIGEARR